MALSQKKLIAIKNSLIKAHQSEIEHEEDEDYNNEYINLAVDVLAELEDSITPDDFAYTTLYKEAIDKILVSRRDNNWLTNDSIQGQLSDVAFELGIKAANHLVKELEITTKELGIKKGEAEITYKHLKKMQKFDDED